MIKHFWKDFADKIWEKKSVVVKQFKSEVSEIKEQHIFQMLVVYSDQCRKIKNSAGFKFYIDGRMQHHDDILTFLPKAKDKNFKGYNQRMESIFQDYCLVCDELLQVSQNEFQRLQIFTETLFKYVGFPNKFVEMGLYVGNYRKTPFGVHVDSCGVFSFPVVGKKTFRIWKPDFVKKNPALNRADKYDKFKKDSDVLFVGVGDMSYWPSKAWHIAESDGQFSATWSLGFWVDETQQQVLKKLIPVRLQKKRVTENELHDIFAKDWILRKSMLGFKTLPSMKTNKKISLQYSIQLLNRDKILWARLKLKKEIIYAYRGFIATSSSENFFELVQDLNSKKICLVSDYLSQADLNLEMGAFVRRAIKYCAEQK